MLRLALGRGGGASADCREAPGCVFTALLQTVFNSFHCLRHSQMDQGRRSCWPGAAGDAKPPGLGLSDVRGTAEGRIRFKFNFVSLNVMQEGWETP